MRRVLSFILVFFAGIVVAAVIGIATGQINSPIVNKGNPAPAKTTTPTLKTNHPKAAKASELDTRVDSLLQKMSTKEKVGQIFMISRKDFRTSGAQSILPGGIFYASEDIGSQTPSQD